MTNSRALIDAALVAPTVTTGQASGITAAGATLAGSLNPGGLATTYSFQYWTSPSNLSFSTPSLDAGSGSGPGAGHDDRFRPEPEPELLVPAGGDELVRNDRRRPGPLHDHCRSARNSGPEHDRDDGTGLVGHLDRRHLERHGDPGRAKTRTTTSSMARRRPISARRRRPEGAGSGSTTVPDSGRYPFDARTSYWFRPRRDQLVGNRERRARRLHVRGDADLGHHRPSEARPLRVPPPSTEA